MFFSFWFQSEPGLVLGAVRSVVIMSRCAVIHTRLRDHEGEEEEEEEDYECGTHLHPPFSP